jgi:hypothetical protein
MAVTAQQGILSFGGQTAKESLAATFYRHRAADIDLATISDDRLGPPEVGGEPTPTIPYRAGVVATGGATINPRLEDVFGWLLYGAMGHVTVTGDEDVLGNTATGMYHHEFVFHTDNGYTPYMSFRKEIPGDASDGSDDLGEIFQDCKIVSMAFALPNDGLITSRVDVLGRAAGTNYDDNPSFSYDNTMEDYQSIPIGCVTGGYIKIPTFSATELPVVAANVAMTNAPLDIRQEKVFGDPYIQAVTTVGRALTVDLVVKWEDPQLYLDILTGSTTGTQWTATPFVSDLDIYALSTENEPTSSTPWGIRVEAAQVMYQVAGGIRLAGNQSVAMRITGTAIADTQYATIHLGNAVTSYTWPT